MRDNGVMSREKVDMVLASIDALNRRDIESAVSQFHAELRFEDVGTGISSTGRVELAAWISEFLEAYSEYRETPEEVVDLEDRVILHMRTDATGLGSGVSISTRHAEIHTFASDGQVEALTVYPTFEAALEAAGVERPSDTPLRAPR
jgi:hypothetical protein